MEYPAKPSPSLRMRPLQQPIKVGLDSQEDQALIFIVGMQEAEFDEHTQMVLNFFPSSDKKRLNMRRMIPEALSDTDSDSSIKFVMEVDDPVIELNEFA